MVKSGGGAGRKREEGGNIKLPNTTELAPSGEEAIDFFPPFRHQSAEGRGGCGPLRQLMM